MLVHLLNLAYLKEQVLLVDLVTALVNPGQLVPVEASHLEHAEHLLLLVKQSEVVREELDLEGVREFADHVIVEEVE